jgi:hypothetical protein
VLIARILVDPKNTPSPGLPIENGDLSHDLIAECRTVVEHE